MKKIVVGLGNPGSRYAKTRHNIGWMVLDRLADRVGAAGSVKARDAAATTRGRLGEDEVVLVKPMTYMNLSGEAVRKALARERTRLPDLLVVVDDMALPFGKLRMRARGSDGGHNGLRSIIAELGTAEFARLRLGIGGPARGAIQHVLGDFEHAEQRYLDAVLAAAADAVALWVTDGPEAAANRWNPWVLEPEPSPADVMEASGTPPTVKAERASKTTEAKKATEATKTAESNTPAVPSPEGGIVRTRTGWRKLLPRGRSAGEDRSA